MVVRKGYEHPEIVAKYVSAIFDQSRYANDSAAREVNDYFSINVDPTARPHTSTGHTIQKLISSASHLPVLCLKDTVSTLHLNRMTSGCMWWCVKDMSIRKL